LRGSDGIAQRRAPTEGGNATFGKALRVRKRAEFQAIQSRARRVPTRHFVLLLSAREPSAHGARLGITASKRIGNAVVRNRVKRIVREAFRHTKGFFDRDIDVVVLVKSDPSLLSPEQVFAEWAAARPRVVRAAEAARTDHAAPAPARTHEGPSEDESRPAKGPASRGPRPKRSPKP
jgi:ribonuclease P protein component